MTFSRFVFKNVARNKRRTLLTVFSIGFSLFLVLTLQTALDNVINPPETETGDLRLTVRSKSMMQPLPISMRAQIEKISGVKLVIPFQWFGGVYRESKNFFPNFVTDPAGIWGMFPEFQIAPDARKTFEQTRRGAVVAEPIMKRFGWKVGDHVTLRGTIFPVDPELEIVGTYTSRIYDGLFFRWDYFNELNHESNIVINYWILAANPDVMPSIMETVDETFRNTPFETKTETEKAFRLQFLSTLGNISALVGSLLSVIVFTMILVAGSTMAMTIRERTREIAILKSIGYLRRTVLMLILGEALTMTLFGFVIAYACSFSLRYINLEEATGGMIQKLLVTNKTYGIALAIGVGIGLIGAIIPAIRASGMTITQALRELD